MGWRYQIPLLLELGFRVVCPDSVGYGRTVLTHFYHFYLSTSNGMANANLHSRMLLNSPSTQHQSIRTRRPRMT
jgi:hypothetical protein